MNTKIYLLFAIVFPLCACSDTRQSSDVLCPGFDQSRLDSTLVKHFYSESPEVQCVFFVDRFNDFQRLTKKVMVDASLFDDNNEDIRIGVELLKANGESLDSTKILSFTYHQDWMLDPVLGECHHQIEFESIKLIQKDGTKISFMVNRGSLTSKIVEPPFNADPRVLRFEYLRDSKYEWVLTSRVVKEVL